MSVVILRDITKVHTKVEFQWLKIFLQIGLLYTGMILQATLPRQFWARKFTDPSPYDPRKQTSRHSWGLLTVSHLNFAFDNNLHPKLSHRGAHASVHIYPPKKRESYTLPHPAGVWISQEDAASVICDIAPLSRKPEALLAKIAIELSKSHLRNLASDVGFTQAESRT